MSCTASSTLDQGRALSIDNEAGALGIFDNTLQDGSEEVAPFWHDEGGPDRWGLAVEDKMMPRRMPTDASTLSRIDLKFRVYGWSEDARDLAHGYILTDSVKATDKRFEVEVAVAPSDNSPRTLRVDALSLGKNPTMSWSSASLNLTFNEDIQIERTRVVDLYTNSVAGSGGGCAHAESADGSFVVHPATAESVPWGTLGIGLDQELLPNQMKYLLIDKGARAVQISKVDLVLPSGPTGMDPPQTRFFHMVAPCA